MNAYKESSPAGGRSLPRRSAVRAVRILNGPNLNLLGTRETGVYGSETLADIESRCRQHASTLGLTLEFRQTNHEGELVDWIQQAGRDAAPVILNPGAYSHTSIAIHDAIRGAEATVIEVHISNIFARESFRQHSYVSPVAAGVICGFGTNGYLLALDAVAAMTAA